MLLEHLSQAHDAASRRWKFIDAQVEWIHRTLLHGNRSRILDLCCGPCFYLQRLARLGHKGVGIDYSPASVLYGRDQAAAEGLDVTVIEGDIRHTEFGGPYDMAMMMSGELNVFRPEDVKSILSRVIRSLAPAGRLLVEVSTMEAIKWKATGVRWYGAQSGLWSGKPHIVLQESAWHEPSRTCVVRYYLVDSATALVRRYSATYQAYAPQDYEQSLRTAGFSDIRWVEGWSDIAGNGGMEALTARLM